MKRNLLWLLATVTVVVLLFGYRTSRGASVVSSTAPIVFPSAAPSSSEPSTAPSSEPGTPSSSASAAPKTASPATPSATPSASSVTVTGDEVQTQWGPVQVSITVAGGKITAVDVPVYPNGTGRDVQINSYALPALVQETISAQSAQIDAVSGATITSNGYLQSLQSAIDKAGL